MLKRKLVAVAVAASALAGCQQIGPTGAIKSDGPLTKAEIEACLASSHKVGDELVSPKPLPHHLFRPGYNFTVKMPDGSTGSGYEEASDGHLLVRYPKHGTSFDLGVARRNGVVYFGDKATSCS
jgi:hypothetical protein